MKTPAWIKWTIWRWISQRDTPITNVLQSHYTVIIHEQTRRLKNCGEKNRSTLAAG